MAYKNKPKPKKRPKPKGGYKAVEAHLMKLLTSGAEYAGASR